MAEGNIRINVDATGARRGAEEARKALEGVGKAARASAQILGQMADEIDDVGDESAKAAKDVDKFKKAELDAAQGAKKLSGTITKVVTALGGMLVIYNVVNSLKKFEDGLVGVGKTTNILGPELDSLGQDIIGLSRGLRTGTDELLQIAQTAGQLGVSGKEGILAFTETMAMLGQASNLVGEEGATKLARMLSIAGEAPETVGTLAAVIVELGNNFAATEKEIAHSATQVALATAAFGVSSAEASAFGAILAALGVRAETGGSSLGRVFRAIDKATRGSAEEMDALRKITGKTAEEISKQFKKSSTQGVRDFIEGLGRLAARGGDVTAALESLGLRGEEILKVLPSMAINSELVTDAFSRMDGQLVAQLALLEENARAMDTFGAEVDRVGNAYGAIKLSMLGANGAMKSTTGFLADVMFALSGVKDKADGVTTGAERTAVALKGIISIGVAAGIALITAKLGAMIVAMKASIALAGGLSAVLATATGGVSVIIGLIAGAATAFALFSSDVDAATDSIRENNEELAKFEGLLDRMGVARAAEVIAKRQDDFGAQLSAIQQQQQVYQDALVQLQVAPQPQSAGMVADLLGISPDDLKVAIATQLTKGIEDGVDSTVSSAALRKKVKDALGILFLDVPALQVTPPKPGAYDDPVFTPSQAPTFKTDEAKEAIAQARQLLPVGERIALFVEEFAQGAVTAEHAVAFLEQGLNDLKDATSEVQVAWDAAKQAATAAANAPTEAMLKGMDALKAYRGELDATKESMERILAGTSTPKAEAEGARIAAQIADARKKLQATLKEGAVVDERELAPLREKLSLIANLAAQVAVKKTQDDLTLSVEKQTAALEAENEVRAVGGGNLAIDLQLKKVELELIDKEVDGRVALLAALRDELLEKKRLGDADREAKKDKAAAITKAKSEESLRQRAAQSVQEMFNSLEMERQALGKNNMERQRFTELLQLEQALRAAGVANTAPVLAAYEQEVRQLQEMAIYQETAANMSQAFGTAFNDIIMGARTVDEAFHSMMDSIGRMLLDKILTEPLMESLTEKLAAFLPKIMEEGVTDQLGGAQAGAAIEAASTTSAATLIGAGETLAAAMVTGAETAAAVMVAGSEIDVGSEVVAEVVDEAAGPAAIVVASTTSAAILEASALTAGATLTTTATVAGQKIQAGCLTGAAAIHAAAAALAAAAKAASVAGVASKSAKGNVFSGGNLVPFAYGGVVSRATRFPMADGRIGLMGEAGPEAIMPLQRGPDGKLGVRGSGPQTINNVTNVQMNVKATDADSFRRSRKQISQDLRRL